MTATTLNVLNITVSREAALSLSSEALMKDAVEKNLVGYANLVKRASRSPQVMIDVENYFTNLGYDIRPMSDEMVEQVRLTLIAAHRESVFTLVVPYAEAEIAEYLKTPNRDFRSAWALTDKLFTDQISAQVIEATRAMFAFGMVSMYVGNEVMEGCLRHGKDLSEDKDYIEFMTGMTEPGLVQLRTKFAGTLDSDGMVEAFEMLCAVEEQFRTAPAEA